MGKAIHKAAARVRLHRPGLTALAALIAVTQGCKLAGCEPSPPSPAPRAPGLPG